VVIDWPTAPDPVVFFDMEQAGYQAAAHLIEHGHERIGIITPPVFANVAPTHTGIHRALTDASLTLPTEYTAHVGDWTTQSGIDGAAQLLDLDPPPTAILALGDLLAIGVIRAAKSRGLTIPTDLALVGFGDIGVAQHLDPPLTTIRQDAAAAGTTATQMLCRLIANEPLHNTRITHPTQLVRRRSCGCPPPAASSHRPDTYRA
jgi:DNA-binding LacI/PurR family transcriptional regulator